MAFTRANVGYVHAIAHQFGGRYHTPHGLANAIMLPHVLEFSMPEITDRMAEHGACAPRSRPMMTMTTPLAQKFLDAVIQMNHDLGIPTHLAALKEADIRAGQGGLQRGRNRLPGAALHEKNVPAPPRPDSRT
jgi:alcohol dehydrogenase